MHHLRGVTDGPPDGPFFAYLVKSAPDQYPIPLPADAIQLGPALIEPRPQDQYGNVTLDFVVPDVEPGEYQVALCNNPCRKPLGDMLPTPITIASDAAEARLLGRIKRIERQQFNLRTRMGPLARRIAHIAADQTGDRLEARAEDLADRVAALERRVDELEANPDSQTASSTRGRDSVSASSLGAMLLVLIACAAFARLERSRPG